MSLRASLRTPRARIVAALVLLCACCVAGLLLLTPSQPGPAGTVADPSRYLDQSAIDAGQDYRSGGRLLLLAGLIVGFGLMGAFALGRPRRLVTALERLDRRPVLGALAAGALLSLLLALADLPLAAWAHARAVDVGISVQDLGGWLFDWVRGNAISLLYAAIGALLLLVLQRRMPRRWWVAGAAIVVAFAFVSSYLAPVVLAPIFNDFERLPEGATRTEVLQLAGQAGVDVEDVYSVNASSRSTSLNAYVTGLGSTRRVVLYDNLVEDAERPALRSVVAHELGHVAGNDILRGLAFVAIIAPAGMLLAREIGDAIAARRGLRPGTAVALPAYVLPIMLVAFALGLVGNVLSRAVEERADRYALELTADPSGLIDLQTQLAERNLSDPDPPGWYEALFATHPSTARRIGIAEAYEATSGPGG